MINKPLATGTVVRIKKGTALWSTNPNKRKFTAGRTYTIAIHDSYPGYGDASEIRFAEVLWAGTGGYWTYAKLDDVEVVK